MASQVLLYQKEVAAILYAVFGNDTFTGPTAYDSVAGQIRTGQLTQQDYIGGLIASTAGQALYGSQSDLQILRTIYTKISGSTPTDATLQGYLNGTTLNNAIYNAIDTLLNYKGFDSATLSSQTTFDNHVDSMLFNNYGSAAWNQWSVALSSQEQVASVYLASANRAADSNGLNYWTTYILKPGSTFQSLIKGLIYSPEFQQKGANLTGDAFITHIYQGVYGTDPSASALATYRAIGTDNRLLHKLLLMIYAVLRLPMLLLSPHNMRLNIQLAPVLSIRLQLL